MNIPRIRAAEPRERVATSCTLLPRTPTTVKENKIYKISGIVAPIIIAFFNSFSLPSISRLNSGIAVNPSSANITTPIGMNTNEGFISVIWGVWMAGKNQMKIPMMIPMIARTPQVSIFLSPRRPFLSRTVSASQNRIPNRSE